jgi:MFS family permease
VVFSVMLLGWAIGGIGFGIIADYIGRTKALAATILIYSLFTGLSAAVSSWEQLAACRFITGLGLGGEWAAGAALVAEVWPDRLRAKAGAMLQSAAAFGYFFAALITRIVDIGSWRYVYLVGAVPAIFVLFIRLMVKEPERWVEVRDRRVLARAQGLHKPTDIDAFTLKQLFSPRLRRDTLVASALAFTVLLALWGDYVDTFGDPRGRRTRGVERYRSEQVCDLRGDAAQRRLTVWLSRLRSARGSHWEALGISLLLCRRSDSISVDLPDGERYRADLYPASAGWLPLRDYKRLTDYLYKLFPTHVRTAELATTAIWRRIVKLLQACW